MKKIIFGIFAHPDDEAFGPSGALLLEAKAGNDVHLMTLTAGEAGANPDNVPDLAKTRLAEWRAVGGIIGAKTMTFLDYHDGQLNNLAMINIGDRLIEFIAEMIEQEPVETVVELMTMDTNGVTGHIDHIVAGRAASFAFHRLKQSDPRVQRLHLSCLTLEQASNANTDWLYMDAGHSSEEIDEIVDARAYKDTLISIVRAHHSQRHDGEQFLKRAEETLGMNYFIVKS